MTNMSGPFLLGCQRSSRQCLLFFFLLVSAHLLRAQAGNEAGLPLITNFKASDYKGNPQLWSVNEDGRGFIYVGGTNVFMEYDGVKWRHIKIPGRPKAISIRAMAKDKNGVLHFANLGDLNYLGKDSLGHTRVLSYLDLVPQENRDFNDIWSIHDDGKGIYYQAREYLFHVGYPDAAGKRNLRVWKPQTRFMYSFFYDGQLYVHQQGLGIFRMISDSLQLMPGSEFLGQERVQIMMPYASPDGVKKFLFGMFNSGLYLYDGSKFQPFATEADQAFKGGALLYKGIPLDSNRFALATAGNGLFIINNKGKLLQYINKNNGLQDESIYSIFKSRSGTIWLSLDNGLARMETSSPVTHFGTNEGVKGQILKMIRFKGDIYLGLTNSIARYNPNTQKFDEFKGLPPSQVFSLFDNGDELLIPGDGVYAFDGNQLYQIRKSVSADFNTTDIRVLKKHPNIMLAVGQVGVAIFTKNAANDLPGRRWQFAGLVPGLTNEIWDVVEDSRGKIWLGTQVGEIFGLNLGFDASGRINPAKCSMIQIDEENEKNETTGRVGCVGGQAYVYGNRGIFTIDESSFKLKPTNKFGAFPEQGVADQFDIREGPDGKVWISMANAGLRMATPLPNGQGYSINDSILAQFSDESISAVYPESNLVWLGTTEGLHKIDLAKALQQQQSAYSTYIRDVSTGKKALPLQESSSGDNAGVPKIAYKENSIRIEFAAPFFLQENKTMYQTWLEGFEEGWSEWNSDHYKEYTNLPRGTYKFHVRARNSNKLISKEATYQFIIEAPWWATWWAYMLYVLAGGAMLFALVGYRTRQLQAKHRELEKQVEERTAELSHRVDELNVINSVQESLVSELEMDHIYELVGEKMRTIFNADVIDIVTYDEKTGLIEDRYAYEKGDRTLLGPRKPSGFRKHIIASGEVLVCNENVEEVGKRFGNEVLIGDMPKSGVWVPMLSGNKVKGIISLQDLEKENSFPPSSISLITTLANSMSVALESARRFDETKMLLKQTEQRTAELAVINSVQEGLARELDMDAIYELVGEKMREIFSAQVIDIVTYDPKTNLIIDRYSFEKGDRSLLPPREVSGFRKQVIDTGEMLLINENAEEAFSKYQNQLLIGERPLSLVFFPLVAGGKVNGVISLQNLDHEHAFSDSDIKLLGTLANSMSVALENARLFDETNNLLKQTEQRTAELAVINSVQEGLVREMDINAIYELVGEKMREIFNAQVIDIVTFNPKTNLITDRYSYEKGDRTLLGPREPKGFRKHVLTTGEMLLHNEHVEEASRQFQNEVLIGEMAKSQVFYPLTAGSKVNGVISLQNLDHEHAFNESDIKLLATLANSMSVALENARLFDETNNLLRETELRNAELAIINKVQDGLVREMDEKGIYELVGDKIREAFNAEIIDIVTYDKSSNLIADSYSFELGDRTLLGNRTPTGFRKHVIETKKPLLIKDNMEQMRQQYGNIVLMGEHTQSLVMVPRLAGGEVTGVVSVQSMKENAFTESDVNLLTTLVNSMSVALENARLFDETTRLLEETKQRANEMSTVNSITQALASQLKIDDLINLVGEQLKQLFKANIVYLAILDEKTNIISFPYQYGDNMAPMKLGDGLTSQIIKNKKPLLINKDLQELRAQMGVAQIGIPAASYLGVPIPVGEQVIGVLSVQSTEHENRFDDNDLRLLNTIGASVGVALRKARLFEEVNAAKQEADTARKAAEKANEAKSAFLSTVSHELRTPLTSVLGFAKIIRKRLEEKIFPATDQSDPKIAKTIQQVSENLDVVVSEGQRLTHLINDVLDLAKIEAGKMEWNNEPLSVIEVAERAIAATTSLFEQSHLRLDKQFETDIPDIEGDRDKLIQVMVNLISNAVKFTPKGKVTCRIYKKDNDVVVGITDTGIGIAPEDHGAVFEQFKQVGDTLTDKPKGTGLGLPICKEIIEHHGGRIWLESEPGKGSTFSFSLPFNKTEAPKPLHFEDLVKQLREQVASTQVNMDQKGARLLIVDDDDSIRSLLQQELSDAGYLIDEAKNGKEALVKVRATRPDLIILDIMMPEMNGFDVAAVLKNDPQTMDIPIIVLSIVQDKIRGYKIGVDRYLTKPIDTGLLFNEIDSLLEQGKSKKKVLIVDEDTSTVNTLTEVLKTKGYQVMESSETDLVEKAVANQPDIIIIKSGLTDKEDYVKTLRFEKGMENVLFLVYQ